MEELNPLCASKPFEEFLAVCKWNYELLIEFRAWLAGSLVVFNSPWIDEESKTLRQLCKDKSPLQWCTSAAGPSSL